MTKGRYKRTSPEETSRKLHLLKQLQAEPFPVKLEFTRRIISMAITKDARPALLYSGGKDSTCLLHLLTQVKPYVLVVHNDTTLGTTDNLNFVRQQTEGLNYIETTASDPCEMWRRTGYYPLLSKRGFTAYKKRIPGLRISPVQCCYQLKEAYANRVLLERGVTTVFWGNRAGESHRRMMGAIDNGFLFQPKKYKWKQAYPILHWSSEDVLNYLREHVPSYPLSRIGEAGCLCCGTDITFFPNNLSKLFRSDRARWEFYMRDAGFAEQIARIKGLPLDKLEEIICESPELLLKI